MQNNLFNNNSYIIKNTSVIPNVFTTYENESGPKQVTVFTPTNNAFYFFYMGIAGKSSTMANVQYEVTTAAGGFTATTSNYCEFLIAKGQLPTPLASPPLTILGYKSVSADVNSIGVKTAGITFVNNLATADEFWFGISLCCTPTPVFRSGFTTSYNLYNVATTAVGTRLSGMGTLEVCATGLGGNTPWVVITI